MGWGLYEWAVHHRLSGWQAKSWPAEIDVFLAVGELALYVAYLDGWPARRRVWPWATALIGLAVSVAGNIGHIQPMPGHPVLLADRLTAATSPLAAFAGLTVGLLVLRMNRQQATPVHQADAPAGQVLPLPHSTSSENGHRSNGAARLVTGGLASTQRPAPSRGTNGRASASFSVGRDSALLRDAADICQTAAARGEHLSQRMLARALRTHGHRFPNQDLHQIALAIGLDPAPARSPAQFQVTGMDGIAVLSARVCAAAGLPELLDAGFDAFEAIRAAARECEDRTPELFAAFMMAAGTATEGRNALNAAPSLPPGTSAPNTNPPVSAAADVYGIADELADLAGLLARRLPKAAATATLPDDRAACDDAARAAAEIHQLLAGDNGETGPW